jgi:ariadne-1
MTCRQCRYEYCWVCLKDWKGHNDYYTCNRYQGKDKAAKDKAAKEKRSRSKRKNDELRRLEMKAALDKYLHYYSRYQNHSHSSELELFREKAMTRMQEIQATEATAAEVRFIKDATDQLLEVG